MAEKHSILETRRKTFCVVWFLLSHLFVCENIKNDDAGGMGNICVGELFTSDIRLGRAEITPTSSS